MNECDIWFDDMHDARCQYVAQWRLRELAERKIEGLEREVRALRNRLSPTSKKVTINVDTGISADTFLRSRAATYTLDGLLAGITAENRLPELK